METRQRYIKIKALMEAGGHPSLAYISADLFVLKHWSIRHEKSASSSLGDDGGGNPLSTAQIPMMFRSGDWRGHPGVHENTL